MDRRTFCATSVGAVAGLGAGGPDHRHGLAAAIRQAPTRQELAPGAAVRRLFPRLQEETYLNAAAGTPLGTFAEAGLDRYRDFWRHGPTNGRGAWVGEMYDGVRERLANLIGADADEVALVHCTKEGEQIVLDGLPELEAGGNVVTNDLHFSGSLHNLVGLRRAGLDVRIVRARDWSVSAEAMADAMDDRTALVSVTLVSNVNGHTESIRELADLAHERGALVYADIIQAAGTVPVDVRAMGIDFAAGNAYKWLFGPHGAGFLYVRGDLQGRRLRDRLYPGSTQHRYPPWTADGDQGEEFTFRARDHAGRYEPGHVSYLGYSALYEGLGFLEAIGVERARDHSVALARRLVGRVDLDRWELLSPAPVNTPIVTFRAPSGADLEESLVRAGIVVTLAGDRVRVSPAVYNVEDDVDRLAEVLSQA